MNTLPNIDRFETDKAYRADPGYNFSTIKMALGGSYGGSLADLRVELDSGTPFKQTAAMELGTLVHALVLEPETVPATYLVSEATDKRTKAYKEAAAVAAAEGLTLVSASVMAQAEAMAAAVRANPEWHTLNTHSTKHIDVECGMAVNDPSGIRLKGKYDALFGQELMVDLKTTADSLDIDNLAKLIVNRNYHVQQALYWHILRQLRPELEYNLPKMAWMFVRTVGAHDTVLVYADDDIMEHAQLTLDGLLRDLAHADQTNFWRPAHPDGCAVATLPRWVRLPEPTFPDTDSVDAAGVTPLPSNI